MSRGFTLLETLIAVALTAFLLGALATLFVSFVRLDDREQASSGAELAVGIAMGDIEDAVIPATHVLSSYSFAAGTYSSNANTLVLELPSVGSDGSIESGHYDHVAFFLSGAAVYRVTAADAASARQSGTSVIGGSIQSLSFSYDNADVTQATRVTATVAAAIVANGAPVTRTFTEAIRLRNL